MSFRGHCVRGQSYNSSALAALSVKRSPTCHYSRIHCQFAWTSQFGTPVATPQGISKMCMRGEDVVVNEMVDSPDVKYAVIAGLRTKTGAECLVIAYPSEESLRDLIAAPSIIAVGLSSRGEAVSRASVPTAATCRRMPRAMAGRERNRQGRNWAEQRGQTGSTLRRLARFLATSYSDLATTATVVFSSTNAVSRSIRMALGSSV